MRHTNRIHWTTDGRYPACGQTTYPGQNQVPLSVTTDPAEVTCRKRECQQEKEHRR